MQSYYRKHRYGNFTEVNGKTFYNVTALPCSTAMGSISMFAMSPAKPSDLENSASRNQYASYTDSVGGPCRKIVPPVAATGYEQGTSIRIEARPNQGYRFVKWEGLPARLCTCQFQKSFGFIAQEDVNVTAVFEKIEAEDPGQGEAEDPDSLIVAPSPACTGEKKETGIAGLLKKYWWAVAALAVCWYVSRN